MFDWKEEYSKMYETSGHLWTDEECLQIQIDLLEYQKQDCPNGEHIMGWMKWKTNKNK